MVDTILAVGSRHPEMDEFSTVFCLFFRSVWAMPGSKRPGSESWGGSSTDLEG